MKNGPYTLVIAPFSYPGKKYRGRYAYEHHVVWWEKYKEVPPDGFEIHHKNENHRDNRIENLILLTGSDHKKHHAQIRSLNSLVNFICFGCAKKKTLPGYIFRRRNKKNKNGLFCSGPCLWRWQKLGRSSTGG